MPEAALRVAIACDPARFPHWQLHCVQELQSVPGVQLTLVLDTGGTKDSNGTSALYRRWLQRRSAPPALALADASTCLSGIPRIPLASLHGSALQEALRPYSIDLILQLGNTALPALQALPRLGVWRFVHGGGHGGSIPGLWEVLQRKSITVAALQREGPAKAEAAILREGHFRTALHSVDRTSEAVLMCCARWPALICRALLAGKADAVNGKATAAPAASHSPTNAGMLRLLWKQFLNKQHHIKATPSVDEEWNIGVLRQPIAALLEEKPNLNVRWLPAPGTGQSRSSPFGYLKNAALNVVYEKFNSSTGMGTIARLRPKPDNNLKRSRTLLEGKGHLTYPYVVEHDGTKYILPEQVSSGRVDLYLLDEEDSTATYCRTLLNEALFSPTLFQHEGRWWLMGTKKPLADTLLHVYYADGFHGPFLPHPLNPVKVDIRSSRPGGTPFVAEGELWRPARDRSREHHFRIALNRVTELTPTSFSEETVKYIEPLSGRWSHGLRTISSAGGITLVDGLHDRSRKPRHQAGSGKKGPKKPRKAKRP